MSDQEWNRLIAGMGNSVGTIKKAVEEHDKKKARTAACDALCSLGLMVMQIDSDD